MSYLVTYVLVRSGSSPRMDGIDESTPSNSHDMRYCWSALASTMKSVEAPLVYSYQFSQLSSMKSHIAAE